jgi:hypothetical protein
LKDVARAPSEKIMELVVRNDLAQQVRPTVRKASGISDDDTPDEPVAPQVEEKEVTGAL